MNDSISCISPIREEVITCAIPEDALESVDSFPTTTVTPKRRSFTSKRSLLTPKNARYASCSNLADLNGKKYLFSLARYASLAKKSKGEAIRMLLVLPDKHVGATSIGVADSHQHKWRISTVFKNIAGVGTHGQNHAR